MLDSLLDNWVRWHKSAKIRRRGRSLSLEGNWRSKQYYDAPPVTPLGKVDQASAQWVEHAWVTLPMREKLLLKWHYVFTRSRGTVCRDMRKHGQNLTLASYAAILHLSRLLLSEALGIAPPPKVCDKPANAVVCAYEPLCGGQRSPEREEEEAA